MAAMADGHRFYQIEIEMPLVTAYIESSFKRPTLELNHFYQLSIDSNIEKPTLVSNQLVSISSDNDYFRGKFEDGSECEQFRFANMQQQPAKHTSVSTTTVQYEQLLFIFISRLCGWIQCPSLFLSTATTIIFIWKSIQ